MDKKESGKHVIQVGIRLFLQIIFQKYQQQPNVVYSIYFVHLFTTTVTTVRKLDTMTIDNKSYTYCVWNVFKVKRLFPTLPKVLIKKFNYLKYWRLPYLQLFFLLTKCVYHSSRIMAIFSSTKTVYFFKLSRNSLTILVATFYHSDTLIKLLYVNFNFTNFWTYFYIGFWWELQSLAF